VITVSNDLGNKPVSQLRDYQSYLDVDFNTGQRILRRSETTNLLIASASSIYSRVFILTDFS
jgi:hypothetical protein